MVGVLVLTTVTFALASKSSGDNDKEKKKKVEKRIEIVDENGQKKVTVTTFENGNKKVETFTGEKAEEYLKNNSNGSGNFHLSFDIDIDTIKGKNSIDFSINGLDDEIEKQIEKIMNELKLLAKDTDFNFDFDKMFKSIDTSILNNNFKIYSFNFNDDMKALDSLMKNSFKFEMLLNDEDVKSDNSEKPSKSGKTIAITKSVVIENLDKRTNAEKDLNISDLSFFPNPGNGNFTLRYKSESLDQINLMITDMSGKTVYSERISATGAVLRNIELSEPTGVYILTLKQGKKSTSKKLVIE